MAETHCCPGCGKPLYRGPGPPWGPEAFCNNEACEECRGKPLPPELLPPRWRPR